jgi:hypothetical protein
MLVRLKKMASINCVMNKHCACDLCKMDLTGKDRYDAATRTGPWAIMCKACFNIHGLGLGIGKGQRFNAEGRCVEGNRKSDGRDW